MGKKIRIILLTLLIALASFFVACDGLGTTAEAYKVTLPVNIAGGIVTADKTEVPKGESVTITATPSLGYELAELAVNGEGLAIDSRVQKYEYTPTSDMTVTASFSLKEYTVSVAETENGMVGVSPAKATMGQTVTVSVSANQGYSIVEISVAKDSGGAVEYESETNSFVMPAENVTVTIVYEQIRLDAPTVTQTGKTLSWTAIENASGYAYSFDEGETWATTEETSLALSSGIHTVWVKTLGNGETSFDSKDISKGEYDARDTLGAPSLTVTTGASAYEIAWAEVENALGYSYRLTVNGEEGEWQTATEKTVRIVYADYPKGEYRFTVEVEAVGGRIYKSAFAETDTLSIDDPAFKTLPSDQIVYGAEHTFDLSATGVTSDDGAVTWKATLIGAEQRSSNSAQWAAVAGETIDYDNPALGYKDGVLTPASLQEAGGAGAYVWANNGLRVEYTVTNAFGRTATCYQTLIVNTQPSKTVTGAYTQELVSDVIGGEVTSVENTVSPILGADRIYKLSNDGKYNYVDFVWNPDAYLGKNGHIASLNFFVYNPNDFDLSFCFLGVGGSTQGWTRVKARTFMKMNGYDSGISAAYAHKLLDETGKLGKWNIDVRKNTGALEDYDSEQAYLASTQPAVYDFYFGNLSYTLAEKTVTLPQNAEGGSVSADKTSLLEGSVTLTVTPEDGYLLSWLKVNGEEVECTDNACVVEDVETNLEVSVAFVKKQFSLTAERADGGTVSVIEKSAWGETVEITLTPDEEYAVRSITVTDEAGNPVEVAGNTFVMPKSNVTVVAVFAKNLVKLNTPTVSYQKSGMGFEVTWNAVENASSYNYRKIVDGVAGGWTNTEETCAMVFYGDHPTGDIKIVVEVVAVGEGNFTDGEGGKSQEMRIYDPAFSYTPNDLILYGVAEYYFPIFATEADSYGMKKAESTDGAVTWSATVIGTQAQSTNAAQWAAGAGETIDYDNASLGYVDGVITPATIGTFAGIYVWANNGIRITYTVTNDFGRTASYTHTVIVNEKASSEVTGLYTNELLSEVVGSVTSVENTVSPILGTDDIYKMSNDGSLNYLEYKWSPDLEIGKREEVVSVSFYVYNPNDFDLLFLWMGTAYKGFYKVPANAFMEINLYDNAEAQHLFTHGMIDETTGKANPWLMDVRKVTDINNPGSWTPAIYDFYVGSVRILKKTV